MRIRSLDHLVLTVRDIEAAGAFCERLGMRQVRFGDGRQGLGFGAQKINLHQSGAEIETSGRHATPGSADIYLLVEGRLRICSVSCRRTASRWSSGRSTEPALAGPVRSLYLRDPDGQPGRAGGAAIT